MRDINAAAADSLKALDPEQPIREANIMGYTDGFVNARRRSDEQRANLGSGFAQNRQVGLDHVPFWGPGCLSRDVHGSNNMSGIVAQGNGDRTQI